MIPRAFIYNDKLYLKVTPSKSLFHSTLVHEVVNRGDIFAHCLDTGVLTIISGTAKVEVIEDMRKIQYDNNGWQIKKGILLLVGDSPLL